jgi:hypothetical protein
MASLPDLRVNELSRPFKAERHQGILLIFRIRVYPRESAASFLARS